MTIADENDRSDLLAPDFYHYPWHGLAAAKLDDRFVVLEWPDGTLLRAFDLWLWENTLGVGVDIATRENVTDPADLNLDAAIASVAVEQDGSLLVTWRSDTPPSHYHPGWLRHVADGWHASAAWLPEQVAWRTEDLSEPPTHVGTHVLDDPEVMHRWMDDLLRYGIARLTDLPLDPDFALDLASRMGAIRDTNFGLIWDVRATVEPNSTANTNFRLCPHTDLPTRETPPGFQFLHCIANTATGGYSTMSDGLAVAQHLAANHPEHYEALTSLHWIFFNRSPVADHRWSGPIIDLGVPGSPLTLRAFHPVRAFPDMADHDIPRAYAALKVFSQTASDPRFRLRYPFRPGDMVGFDNRRILHGRDAYESEGRRHLRGLYIDHDEVHSFVRVSARRRYAGEG